MIEDQWDEIIEAWRPRHTDNRNNRRRSPVISEDEQAILDYLQDRGALTLAALHAAFPEKGYHSFGELLRRMATRGLLTTLGHTNHTPIRLYALPGYQWSIVDLPNGVRNERILAQFTQDHTIRQIAQAEKMTTEAVKSVLATWEQTKTNYGF
jgi:hypothetical protein